MFSLVVVVLLLLLFSIITSFVRLQRGYTPYNPEKCHTHLFMSTKAEGCLFYKIESWFFFCSTFFRAHFFLSHSNYEDEYIGFVVCNKELREKKNV
jgi:hypothetical protein